MTTFLRLLKETLSGAVQNGCFSTAKGVAYSLILGFFPSLLLLATALARKPATAALMLEVTHALGHVLPPSTVQMALQYFSGGQGHPVRLILSALLVSLMGGSGVMTSFMMGFRAVYGLPPSRSYWKDEGLALALVFLAGAPLLAATALIVFGKQVQNWLIYRLGFPILLTAAWAAARWVVAVATGTVVLAIIYSVGPRSERRFAWVLPGALLATLAWLASTAFFGWYVQNVAEYSDIYGSLGTAVVLLIWMYLLAVIVLLGAQFNAVCERHWRGV